MRTRRRWVPWFMGAALLSSIPLVWFLWPAAAFDPPPRPVPREPPVAHRAIEEPPSIVAHPTRKVAVEPEVPEIAFREAPPERVTLTVRDIADGKTVADLAFATGGKPGLAGTSGPGGVLLVEKQWASSLKAQGDEWTALRPVHERGWAPDTIWVYRRLTVLGRVQAESQVADLDLTRVKLRLLAVGEPEGASAVSRPFLDSHWFDRQRLDQVRKLAEVKADGTFRATVPRIPGYAISAAAPGWQPDSYPVDVACDPCQISLALHKASLRLAGRVTTSDGKPLAGVTVQGFVTVRMRADEIDREEIRAKGHGYKLRASRKEGWALLTYLLSAKTKEDGTFGIASNVRGELSFFVSPGGQGDLQSTRVDEGNLSGDRQGFDFMVPKGDGSRVTLLRDGVPLAKEPVMIMDLSYAEQPGVGLKTDDRGQIPASVLVSGHKMAIGLKREFIGFGLRHVIWKGESRLDLAKLPSVPPWPVAR